MTHRMLVDTAGRVVLAGDWHGNSGVAVQAIHAAADAGAAGILHLGDFGIWPGRAGKAYLFNVNRALARTNLWLAFIDGNHEDHDQIDSLPIDAMGVRPVREHILHLPRGFRWTWHGKTWLALGGAVSLDQRQRTPGIDWWPQERISMPTLDRVINDGAADFMVTHDVPAGVDVPGLDDRLWIKSALRDAYQHREGLRTVVEAVRPAKLWHGHMHVAYSREIQHDGWTCVVQGLGADVNGLADNMVLIDPANP